MSDLNARDAKLVQWLNEAHAKEAELEADLTAHIALTDRPSYKKRLQQHLKETRDHKRRVASRIKKLGGTPATLPLPDVVPGPVGEVAGKALAAVKGQVAAARAVITDPAERQLRNAQEELREEHVEIAIYTRIEAFADAVGDRETAQLARAIRRDEERMAKFLDAELKRLVKAVVKEAVPAAERNGGTRRRRASTARSRTTTSGSASKTTGARKPAASSARKASTTRRGAGGARANGSSRRTAARSR
jgi:ferritin-like metal-binding protein YciE